MKTYFTTRPLHFGAGHTVAVGGKVELDKRDAERLLASGAVSETKAEKKPANKMRPKPANKSKD